MATKLIPRITYDRLDFSDQCASETEDLHSKCPGYLTVRVGDECKAYNETVTCECRHHKEPDRFRNVPKE